MEQISSTQPPNLSTTNEHNLKKIIREIGVKVTDQRMAILDHILKSEAHLTAQSVFETVKATNPDIGFATVYRFLRTLTDHKILSEVRIQGLPARYEWANKDHHDHITCVQCGKICEFENEHIENLQTQIANSLGFQLTHHIMELYGVCMDCQKKSGQLPTTNNKIPFT